MRKNNPIHVDAAYLAWLSQQKSMITLSPKADGVYNEIRIGRYIFLGELVTIGGQDIYLIFDTPSYPIKHKDNLVNRMKWIRNMHPIAKKLDVLDNYSNSKEFIDLCEQDTELLKEYLHDNRDKIKWYPKITITSNMNHDVFLKLLDVNIDSHLSYKTDGWIITSLKKNCASASAAKYKAPTSPIRRARSARHCRVYLPAAGAPLGDVAERTAGVVARIHKSTRSSIICSRCLCRKRISRRTFSRRISR